MNMTLISSFGRRLETKCGMTTKNMLGWEFASTVLLHTEVALDVFYFPFVYNMVY